MLTERVEIDVLDDHHLVVIDGEQSIVKDIVDVCAVPGRQESQGFFHARRRADEPFAVGILTEFDQEAPDEILHSRILQRRFSRFASGTSDRSNE